MGLFSRRVVVSAATPKMRNRAAGRSSERDRAQKEDVPLLCKMHDRSANRGTQRHPHHHPPPEDYRLSTLAQSLLSPTTAAPTLTLSPPPPTLTPCIEARDAETRAREAMRRLPLLVQRKDRSLFDVLQTLSEANILLVARREKRDLSRAWHLFLTQPPSVTSPANQVFSSTIRIVADTHTEFAVRGRLNTREKFRVRIWVTEKGRLRGEITRSLSCPVHEHTTSCMVCLTFLT